MTQKALWLPVLRNHRAFLLSAKKDLLFDVIFSMAQSVLEISLLDGQQHTGTAGGKVQAALQV